MHNFLGVLRRASGNVVMIVVVATLIVVALSGAVLVSSLIGRVEKLESDLKSLRSDLDHPRVRPLASIVDAGARLRQ
jgi:hypothetical protein